MVIARFALYGFVLFVAFAYPVFSLTESTGELVGLCALSGLAGAISTALAAFAAQLLFQFYMELMSGDRR